MAGIPWPPYLLLCGIIYLPLCNAEELLAKKIINQKLTKAYCWDSNLQLGQ
jgi:hypothetical protein